MLIVINPFDDYELGQKIPKEQESEVLEHHRQDVVAVAEPDVYVELEPIEIDLGIALPLHMNSDVVLEPKKVNKPKK